MISGAFLASMRAAPRTASVDGSASAVHLGRVWMVHLLIAAALAAAPVNAPPASADAEPAMFMVRDADTTIYLFGTFHALDGKSDWFSSGVKSAFDQSGELVLETLVPENPTTVLVRPAVQQLPVTTSASFLGTTRLAISAGKSQGM